MLERDFQSHLIVKLKSLFPDGVVLKNDPDYKQGIPDLLILVDDKWAMLECKRAKDAHRQPNQEYYVDKLGKMGYSAFIYPENEDDILKELVDYFR